MTRARLVELGRHLSSRDRARKLREDLLRSVGPTPEHITVDMEGVLSLSDSFADELFAVLAQEKGVRWFKETITVANASPVVRAAVLRAVRVRMEGSPPDRADTGRYRLAVPPEELELAP